MTQAPPSPVATSNGQSPTQPGSNNQQISRTVSEVIGEIGHIATLPEITVRIIQIVEDPQSSAQDLNKVIAHDPAMGTRILRVVNSAFYGLPGQIGSINRAIVLLGLNAVKNIAIAASLAKLFRGGRICPQFDARDLWAHSVANATASQMLAQRIGLGLPDEAFLAGLIHDLGIMIEIQARRPQFAQAMREVDRTGVSFRQAEQANLGANHEHFGAGLSKLWKFPHTFAYVTGFHHHPWDLPASHRTLASLVHIADILAARVDDGLPALVEHDEVRPSLLEELRLSKTELDEVHAQLPDAIEETKAIFQATDA